MAAYFFKFIGRPPVTGTPVGSRTVKPVNEILMSSIGTPA